MSFLNPEYFWLLLFFVALFIKQDNKALRFTSYGYLLTFLLLILALTRPVIHQEPLKTQELLNDVVIAVDLSYSMQANDILPTRLSYSKKLLAQLVKSEKKSRFGVLGFTTNALVLSPLTQDSELLLHLFGALDEKQIMTKGSSIMPALRLARKMSKTQSVSVVLFTDGADELNYADEAAYAKENGLIVNVLMSATKMGGTLRLADGTLLQDELGDIVVTRENTAIEAIVKASGGVYTKDIQTIISALRSQRNTEHKADVTLVQNQELFYYFVALALLVFLVSITTLKRYVLVVLVLLGINLNAGSLEFQNAVKLYKDGDYEGAAGSFSMLKSSLADVKSIIYFNLGNSLVRLKEFKRAREAYRKSLTLKYSKEADENLEFIKDVKEQEQMSSGQQKSAKKSDLAKQKESSAKKKKSGGGSNMKVDTAASGASKTQDGKKTKQEQKFDLNAGKAKLSSKQYELINKRQNNEKHPW